MEARHHHARAAGQPPLPRVIEEPARRGPAVGGTHRPQEEEESLFVRSAGPRFADLHQPLLDLAHGQVGVEAAGEPEPGDEPGFDPREEQPVVAAGEYLVLVREVEGLGPHGPRPAQVVAHIEGREVLDAGHRGNPAARVRSDEPREPRVLDDGHGGAADAVQQGLVVPDELGQGIEPAAEVRLRHQPQGVLEVARHGASSVGCQRPPFRGRIVAPRVVRDQDVVCAERVLQVPADLVGAPMPAVAYRLGGLVGDEDGLHEAGLASARLLNRRPIRARSRRARSDTR